MKYFITISVVAVAVAGFVFLRAKAPEPLVTATPAVSGTGRPVTTNTGTPAASVAPTAKPTASPTQAVQATPDTRCIVTINGDRYDVTTFRTIHKGGDVFKCGTDMSAAYAAQHPMSLLLRYAGLKVQ